MALLFSIEAGIVRAAPIGFSFALGGRANDFKLVPGMPVESFFQTEY